MDWLGKDDCNTRRKTFEFLDLVRFILEVCGSHISEDQHRQNASSPVTTWSHAGEMALHATGHDIADIFKYRVMLMSC